VLPAQRARREPPASHGSTASCRAGRHGVAVAVAGRREGARRIQDGAGHGGIGRRVRRDGAQLCAGAAPRRAPSRGAVVHGGRERPVWPRRQGAPHRRHPPPVRHRVRQEPPLRRGARVPGHPDRPARQAPALHRTLPCHEAQQRRQVEHTPMHGARGSIVDVFDGVEFTWTSVETDGDDKKKGKGGGGGSPRESLELSFDAEHTDMALERYVPFVMSTAEELQMRDRALRIFMNEGRSWHGINHHHPATFDTLAMDPVLEDSVIADLDRFLKRRDYYRRIGKAWKRGYLLYGHPALASQASSPPWPTTSASTSTASTSPRCASTRRCTSCSSTCPTSRSSSSRTSTVASTPPRRGKTPRRRSWSRNWTPATHPTRQTIAGR
jgi:hypothetical protein